MSDQITVVGTIVNDPEQRRTGAGHAVINFRLASNVRRRDEATGAWVDGHTNWYSVSAYRGLAEHALASLRKGHRVFVSGAFRVREWEANGRHGVAAEIDAVSLGHDLLWGTTQYRRAEGATKTPAAPPAAAFDEGAVGATPRHDERSVQAGLMDDGSDDVQGTGGDGWGRGPLQEATPF